MAAPAAPAVPTQAPAPQQATRDETAAYPTPARQTPADPEGSSNSGSSSKSGIPDPVTTGFSRAHSVGLVGVQAHLVEVEVHLAAGLPGCVITGLADVAVAEARDRVRAAVINSGEAWPPHRITIGLGPAALPKHGSAYDLAVAIAVLCAAKIVPAQRMRGCVFIGELGLGGRVRPVRGVLPTVSIAVREGFSTIFVPEPQLAEATLVPGIRVVGIADLSEAVAILRGEAQPRKITNPPPDVTPHESLCMSDVVGQNVGRLAMEVAAAGGHHVALLGPPGAGKTMLAERLPSLLPRLTEPEALEVTTIHSVAGAVDNIGLITRPPYQAPHHTSTMPALVGGGTGLARPGAVSLAHRGVLFLDEATEFSPRVLDALREPLERGEVVLARAAGIVRYPARVQLVVAANPCPCAAARAIDCLCGATVRRRYLGRLSGPLMDRVDIQVDLPPITPAALFDTGEHMEGSAEIASRVSAARASAAQRWGSEDVRYNAHVPGARLRGPFRLPLAVSAPVDRALDRGELSARGYDSVLRLAWTLSDLDGRTSPRCEDVRQAAELRLRRPV